MTGAISLTGPAITGASAWLRIWNSTSVGTTFSNTVITPGQEIYFSLPLSQLNLGMNTTPGAGYSSSIKFDLMLDAPAGSTSSDLWTATLSGLAFTDYAIPLGTNATGSPIVNAINPRMATFGSPELKYSKVIDNGYTVAVSQTLQNITESQTSISDGSYIEEATYQGTLNMPTEPDLTYGTSNITLNMRMPGDQYTVATLNGVSYLSAIEAQKNGTFSFGTVNPNSPNSMILEAKYTASQWDASTHAPSFFTLRGIEYYWWVGVIGLLSLIGLGAAASAHWGGEEDDLKVPKGKFGR